MSKLEKKSNKVVLISVDLETLGVNTANAPILSIGAFAICFSEVNENRLRSTSITTEDIEVSCLSQNFNFYKVVNSNQEGRVVEEETLEWWGKQSDEAKALLEESKNSKTSLKEALESFTHYLYSFIDDDYTVVMLGNGACFDNSLLEIAYRQYNLPIPWSYKYSLCMRTLLLMNNVGRVNYHQILPNYIPHHALDDAKVQGLKLFRSRSILLMLLESIHRNISSDSKK